MDKRNEFFTTIKSSIMAVLFTFVHLICSLCACTIRPALLYPTGGSTVQLSDSIGTVSFYF